MNNKSKTNDTDNKECAVAFRATWMGVNNQPAGAYVLKFSEPVSLPREAATGALIAWVERKSDGEMLVTLKHPLSDPRMTSQEHVYPVPPEMREAQASVEVELEALRRVIALRFPGFGLRDDTEHAPRCMRSVGGADAVLAYVGDLDGDVLSWNLAVFFVAMPDGKPCAFLFRSKRTEVEDASDGPAFQNGDLWVLAHGKPPVVRPAYTRSALGQVLVVRDEVSRLAGGAGLREHTGDTMPAPAPAALDLGREEVTRAV